MTDADPDADPDDSFLPSQDQDDTATTTTFPRQPLLTLTNDASSTVSPLEQAVLDEYARLLGNMNHVSSCASTVLSYPILAYVILPTLTHHLALNPQSVRE